MLLKFHIILNGFSKEYISFPAFCCKCIQFFLGLYRPIVRLKQQREVKPRYKEIQIQVCKAFFKPRMYCQNMVSCANCCFRNLIY